MMFGRCKCRRAAELFPSWKPRGLRRAGLIVFTAPQFLMTPHCLSGSKTWAFDGTFLLLILGLPLAVSMLGASLLFILVSGSDDAMMAQRMIREH